MYNHLSDPYTHERLFQLDYERLERKHRLRATLGPPPSTPGVIRRLLARLGHGVASTPTVSAAPTSAGELAQSRVAAPGAEAPGVTVSLAEAALLEVSGVVGAVSVPELV